MIKLPIVDRLKKAKKSHALIQEMIQNREYVSLRPFWGFANWAIFYIFLGGREAGKSYDVMEYVIRQHKKGAKIFWLRLKESSLNKMLANNGDKFVDPDLVVKYKMDITTRAGNVYNHKKLFCRALTLSTSYNDKGSALYDNTYKGEIIVVLDEMQLEKGERRTFDVVYNYVNQIENIVRSRKKDIKLIMIANTTEEACDILARFEFIPQDFGIFKLKSKRAVIVNLEPTNAYKARRKGTAADILAGTESNFTNKLELDISLVYKKRLISPSLVIKFSKDKRDWFTIWDGNIVALFNGEKKPCIAMRRYIDSLYTIEKVNKVYELYDTRALRFKNLMTQRRFSFELSLIKK